MESVAIAHYLHLLTELFMLVRHRNLGLVATHE